MKAAPIVIAGLLFGNAAVAQGIPPPAATTPQGVLRVWGNPMMADVIRRWVVLFHDVHPGVQVELKLLGSDVAMAGLYTGQADIALLGRQATSSERKAFEWVYRYPAREVAVMRGSVGTPGRSPALALMVNGANPLSHLSLEQLARVFRTGKGAIRTWGGLGLEGEWRRKPIRLYLPDAESGTGRYFRHVVLQDSNKMPWDRVREFAEDPLPPGTGDLAARNIVAALAADPAGLAIAATGAARAGVKVLAVAAGTKRPLLPDEDTVGAHRYPLSRTVFAYVNGPPGKALGTETRTFLALMLSDRGQAAIAQSGGYLPLHDDRQADGTTTGYLEASWAKYLGADAPAGYNSRKRVGINIDYTRRLSGLDGRHGVYLVLGASQAQTRFLRPRPGDSLARADILSRAHVFLGRGMGPHYIF